MLHPFSTSFYHLNVSDASPRQVVLVQWIHKGVECGFRVPTSTPKNAKDSGSPLAKVSGGLLLGVQNRLPFTMIGRSNTPNLHAGRKRTCAKTTPVDGPLFQLARWDAQGPTVKLRPFKTMASGRMG